MLKQSNQLLEMLRTVPLPNKHCQGTYRTLLIQLNPKKPSREWNAKTRKTDLVQHECRDTHYFLTTLMRATRGCDGNVDMDLTRSRYRAFINVGDLERMDRILNCEVLLEGDNERVDEAIRTFKPETMDEVFGGLTLWNKLTYTFSRV